MRKIDDMDFIKPICDLIKQNESELANIDFEIEPIIQLSLYFNVLSITKMAKSLEQYA